MSFPDGFEQLALDTIAKTAFRSQGTCTERDLREDVTRLSLLLQTFGRVLDVEIERTRTEVSA